MKKTYKISGMDCAACAKMLELDLEDIGVSASCNYDSESLVVDFEKEKVSEEKILGIIKDSGYSAT